MSAHTFLEANPEFLFTYSEIQTIQQVPDQWHWEKEIKTPKL